MANEEHLARVREGMESWNAWRRGNWSESPNLNGANLSGMNLAGGNFRNSLLDRVNLKGAKLDDAIFDGSLFYLSDFSFASLTGAQVAAASFSETNFEGANLARAVVRFSVLDRANFKSARLRLATFQHCSLLDCDMSQAQLGLTVFAGVNFQDARGLETCCHIGPSSVDWGTLSSSNRLSDAFLQGVGLSDSLIDYAHSLTQHAIQHYSSFISYSTSDQEFSIRLHSDLQNKGIRCWFAAHDMRIGDKILDTIDSAIRLRDRVLLILSEHSIESDWVEDEVTKAFEEERKRGQIVLFPIRLDDAVMDTNEAWAAKLRARHIGDFRRWKEHDEYQKSFARVLRDLTVKKP